MSRENDMSVRADRIRWVSRSRVEKFQSDEDVARGTPYEVLESGPNLLLTAGATLMWSLVCGAGGTALNSSNAYLCVGDSNTAASVGQTDLQAVTNKVRVLVDGAPTLSTNQAVFAATFGYSTGNFQWREWGVANASTSGTLLNRFVEDLGTKTSAAIWVLTITLELD
jgi:hypothetical protein